MPYLVGDNFLNDFLSLNLKVTIWLSDSESPYRAPRTRIRSALSCHQRIGRRNCHDLSSYKTFYPVRWLEMIECFPENCLLARAQFHTVNLLIAQWTCCSIDPVRSSFVLSKWNPPSHHLNEMISCHVPKYQRTITTFRDWRPRPRASPPSRTLQTSPSSRGRQPRRG